MQEKLENVHTYVFIQIRCDKAQKPMPSAPKCLKNSYGNLIGILAEILLEVRLEKPYDYGILQEFGYLNH